MRFVIFFSAIFFFLNSAKAELTLLEAVRFAYENNPELKAQDYSVEAARSQKQKAYGGFLPNVSADINSGKQKTKIVDGATFKGDANKKSINLSQDLFNGGATYFDVRRAGSVVSKEQAIKNLKEQEIALQVIQSYLDILRFEALLRVEQDNLESQNKILSHTKIKLAARDATKSEFAKASADCASAVSSKIAAENNLTSAKTSFSKLTGIALGEITALKEINDESFHSRISDLNSVELFEMALKNNPELQAARYAVESAKHQSSITKSSFSPTVKLTAASAEEKNPLYYSNSRYHNNSVYVNLHVPIFSSGVEYANMSEANNLLQREKYNLDAITNRIRQQTVEYTNKIRNFYAQYESLKEQESANEIYVLTLKEEERLGTKSIIDLLRAKQDLYIARVNKTNVHYDKIVTIFNLKSLVGGLTHDMIGGGDMLSNFDEKSGAALDVENTPLLKTEPTTKKIRYNFSATQS